MIRGALRRALSKAKTKAEYRVIETRLKHGSVRRWAGGKAKSGAKRAIVGTGKGIYYGTQHEHRKKLYKKLPHKRLESHLFGPKGYKGRFKKRTPKRQRTQKVVVLFDTRPRTMRRMRPKRKRRIGEFDMPDIDV